MTVPEPPRGQVIVARDHATQYIVQGGNQYVYERGPAHQVEPFPLTTSAPDPAWLLEQPSRLLDARSQVVEFAGRDQELEDLSKWRDNPRAALAVRLLHGPGGQGKTRLATRFAQLSSRADWTVLHARYGAAQASTTDSAWGVQAACIRGHLMIVDYADRWPHGDLLRLLTDPLLHQGLPARVLLLGRSVQWWPAMRGELAELRATADDLLLRPLAGTTQAREEMFHGARDRFAELLGVDQPARIQPPPSLTDETYGLVLALHMAALVAVDAHRRGQRLPTDPEGLAAYLLDREYMNWRRLYDSRTRGEEFRTPPSVMARTVFTAVLTGPARHRAGTKVLKNLELKSRSRILTDHRVCYPPLDRATVLEPLYPDRLAEDFLALMLPGHNISGYDPDPWAVDAPTTLLTRSANDQPPPYTPRTITFLAAAAARWPHAAEHLNAILADDPALAVEAGSAALTALADVPTIDIAVLEAIERYFPAGAGRHVALDAGIAAISTRLARHRLAASSEPATHARVYADLSHRLDNAGLHEQALAASQLAVEIRRRLAAADPIAFEPDLSATLTNHGTMLSQVRRREDALAVTEEAVEICRRLAAVNPAVHEPLLASALTNLGSRLSELGRREDALTAAEEAAALCRRLAGTDQARHEPNLAAALTILGSRLSELGRGRDALAVTEQAVAVRRRLAEVNPAAFAPDLANALGNLGNRLSDLGRRADAVVATGQAVEIYRRLAAVNPAAFNPDLAGNLSDLGIRLAHLGQRDEALTATEENVAMWRRLADVNPIVYGPDLARALSNLGMRLSELERQEEALTATEESARMYRPLAAVYPAVFDPYLAGVLGNFAIRLARTGRREEALTVAEENVAIYRRLAKAHPAAHEPDLAKALSNLGNRLSDLGRREEAMQASEEAAMTYRRLAEAEPAAFEPNLAATLINLSFDLSVSGREQDALIAAEQAVEIYRRLAEMNLAAHAPNFATALSNLGAHLSAAGRHEDALMPTKEAVAFRRWLAGSNPAAFDPDLAEELENLGTRLAALERWDAALTATKESVQIYQRLTATNPAIHESSLARSLWTFARVHARGQVDLTEGLAAVDASIRIYQTLVTRQPGRFVDDLDDVQQTRADLLDRLGRSEDATQVRRMVARDDADAERPDS